MSEIATPKFRKLLATAVFVPVILTVAVSALLAWQVGRLLQAAAHVEQHDGAIACANEVMGRTVDMETGLRGYLVAGVPIFLEPYEKGRRLLPGLDAELRRDVSGHPEQTARLSDLKTRRDQWMSYAARCRFRKESAAKITRLRRRA